MKILTHRGHCAHQYELWKLPYEFTCVTGIGYFTDSWNDFTRPLHSNVTFKHKDLINIKDYDIAIIHIDEFFVNPPPALVEWGWKTRRDYFMSLDLPKIFVMHGTDRRDEPIDSPTRFSSNGTIRELLKNHLVVCNTEQQAIEWDFNNYKAIYHGFDPKEFVQTNMLDRSFYINPSTVGGRSIYNGEPLFEDVSNKLGNSTLKIPLIKNNFNEYLHFISNRTFFLNFTYCSPMPRSRGESLMSGNIVISTSNYNWGDFINQGVDGFLCDNSEMFIETINYLKKCPESELIRLSKQARKKAMDVFHIDRFLSDWKNIIKTTL